MAVVPAKVLLIEEDADLRELNAQVLSYAGYHVEQLPLDGDPVAFAEQNRPEAIVIGFWPRPHVGMQIIDGFQKSPQTAAIPVVAYTPLRKFEVISTPCTRVPASLVAPYNIIALQAAVARALEATPAVIPLA